MRAQRLSIVWPLFVLALAALWLLQSLGLWPSALTDLVSRVWPGLLIAVGLMLLIGRRVRFGNLLALVLCTAVIGGIAVAGFNQQASRVRTDNRKVFTQVIEPQITTVNIVVNTLNTQLTVIPDTSATINAEFTGSRDSRITSDFQVDGATGTFTLVETQTSTFPSLEGLGRGTLKVTLPTGITVKQVSVSVIGSSGDITFDPTGTALTDVTVAMATGKATFSAFPATLATLSVKSIGDLELGTLPASLTTLRATTGTGKIIFDATAASLKTMSIAASAGNVEAKLPEKSGLIGDIKAGGEVSVKVPPTIAANVKLDGNAANNPTYSQADYILNKENILLSRRSNEPQLQLTIESGGRTTIQ
ncbi:MAG: hypothetical protein ABI947_29415 [Chloroflexota bacterium]